MRLLVTGSSGMLGRDVMRAGERAGYELTGLTHSELDVTDPAAVERAVARVAPDAVVNCAAWTDVDGAETHRQEARAVNVDGASHLARGAPPAGGQLVHAPPAYVFPGDAPLDEAGPARPYVE